jgi:hypothetical protein
MQKKMTSQDSEFSPALRIKVPTKQRLEKAIKVEELKRKAKRVFIDEMLDELLQNYEAANAPIYTLLDNLQNQVSEVAN